MALALTGMVSMPGQAQVMIGDNRAPSVEVDQSVLDRLGAEPTLPALLLHHLDGSQPPQLLPPNSAAGPLTLTPEQGFGQTVVLVPPKHRPVRSRPIATTAARHPAAAKPVSSPRPPLVAVTAPTPPQASPVLPPTPPQAAAPVAPVPPPQVTPAVVAAPPQVKTPQVAAAAPKAPPPPPDTAAASPDDHPPPPTLPPPVVPSVDTPPPADIPPPSPVSGKQGLAGAAGLPAVQEAKLSATAAPSVINALPDGGATILFGKDGANLPGDAIAALTRLAGLMKADDSLQVGLLAYADGDEDNASKARRLSLTRGLAVRSFLIDQGIRNTRIVVRALGNKVPAGPADRVDIQVQKH